MTEFSSLLNLA